MKHPVLVVFAACAAFVMTSAAVPAEERNGLRVSVQKTEFDRDKDPDAFYGWDRVAKLMGLRFEARNVSMKDMPEGRIQWTVLVERWGQSTGQIERFTGADTLPPLRPGETASKKFGQVKIGGWETNNNRRQFMDKIEAWEVVVTHNGQETLRAKSGAGFDKTNSRAVSGRTEESAGPR